MQALTVSQEHGTGTTEANDLLILGAVSRTSRITASLTYLSPHKRPLLSYDVDASTMETVNGLPVPGLWTNVVLADVQGKRRLVKLYHESAGGEAIFLRDLRWWGKNLYVGCQGFSIGY